MDNQSIQTIYEISDRLVRETGTGFHRYLASALDWSVRILALNGPRGVGKTTRR